MKYNTKKPNQSATQWKLIFFKDHIMSQKQKKFYAAFLFLSLILFGTLLSFISMYFGASSLFGTSMFKSYFRIGLIPLLNTIPVIILIFTFYLITNRVWASFLITSLLTIGLTWANYFKIMFRDDMLLAGDLRCFSEALALAGQYHIHLNWKMNFTILFCIMATIASFFLYRHVILRLRVRLVLIVLAVFIGVFLLQKIYLNSEVYAKTKNYDKLYSIYNKNEVFVSRGFIYPFLASINDNIIHEPLGYNEEEVINTLSAYSYKNIPEDKKVNIIVFMLEAYSDLSNFDQIELNVDVYEYLHKLQKEAYHGELVTNVFAAGTENTERCFLTGLTSTPNYRRKAISYVRYFKEQGYTVEGSHPHYQWFYNRKNINEYLGFNKYYFLENFYNKYRDVFFCRDEILFDKTIDFYEKNKDTGKPYFNFSVSVQNHGPYNKEKTCETSYLKNKGYSNDTYCILNTYLAGIYNTNLELEKFVEKLRNDTDPVVLIFFGDHKPWLGNKNSVYNELQINLNTKTKEGFYNYFNTPYVIWGNNAAKVKLKNNIKGNGNIIGPYFLMNEFFQLIDYEGNEFMQYSNSVKEKFPVIHAWGNYIVNDNLLQKLNDEQKAVLQKFNDVNYFLKANYFDFHTILNYSLND